MKSVTNKTKIAELSIPTHILCTIDKNIIIAKTEAWLRDVTLGTFKCITDKKSFGSVTYSEHKDKYTVVFHAYIPVTLSVLPEDIRLIVNVYETTTDILLKPIK